MSNLKNKKTAVLGASGAVGREMIRILREKGVPPENLRLLTSGRSAGKTVGYGDAELVFTEATAGAFTGCDIVLGAVSAELSRSFAPVITDSGAVYIDNSSAFRSEPDVPLVIPEINPEAIRLHRGIIANPNCTTIITSIAVSPLNRVSKIKSMVVSTYQAVSGAGAEGMRELEEQLSGGRSRSVFPRVIAGNLIPFIGINDASGYTDEELKMQREARKIFGLPELLVSCTCVRVPVMRAHSVSVRIVTEKKITPEEAALALSTAPGCVCTGKEDYPTPLDAAYKDGVYIGRIREDMTDERGLLLWCCGDQLRRGAALNAVLTAELL